MSNESIKATKDKEHGAVPGKPVVPTVNWDDSSMKTSYANVVNAASTREEVTLFFGTNLTWNPGESREFHVRLSDRIVLSPYAAKRLWLLVGAILKEYESRFGALPMDAVGSADVTQAARGAKSP
jgi:Protein of unknown function (DUF3467)